MANGLPALLNDVNEAVDTVALVAADSEIVLNLFRGPQWGIGIGGVFQIVPDSVIDLDFKRDWSVPDYPQEAGAFEQYNKVATPYDARLRMSKGGSEADRAQFLASIDTLSGSTTLVDVVTPTKIYNNANVVHYDYRRTATNGVTLLTVDIWLLEIRVAPNPAFTNTAQASGQDSQNTGTVQAQTPTSQQSAAASLFQ